MSLEFSPLEESSLLGGNDVQIDELKGSASIVASDLTTPPNELVIVPGEVTDSFCLRFHKGNEVKYKEDCSENA